MKKLKNEFKQDNFQLNLQNYLTLAQRKIWIGLISATTVFLFVLGVLIYSFVDSTFGNSSQPLWLYAIVDILLVPLVISFSYSLWWFRLILASEKIENNWEMIKYWHPRKKQKYFNYFITIAKINFRRRDINQTITEAKATFDEYIFNALELNIDIYERDTFWSAFFSPLEIFLLGDAIGGILIFLIWIFISALLFIFPRTHFWIKYHALFRTSKNSKNNKNNVHISNNFNFMMSEFLIALGVKDSEFLLLNKTKQI